MKKWEEKNNLFISFLLNWTLSSVLWTRHSVYTWYRSTTTHMDWMPMTTQLQAKRKWHAYFVSTAAQMSSSMQCKWHCFAYVHRRRHSLWCTMGSGPGHRCVCVCMWVYALRTYDARMLYLPQSTMHLNDSKTWMLFARLIVPTRYRHHINKLAY